MNPDPDEALNTAKKVFVERKESINLIADTLRGFRRSSRGLPVSTFSSHVLSSCILHDVK